MTQLTRDRRIDSVQLPKLTASTKLTIASPDAMMILVTYVVSNDAPHMQIQYAANQQKSVVTQASSEDALDLTLMKRGSCNGLYRVANTCEEAQSVTMYGPALTNIAVKQGVMLSYKNDQSQSVLELSQAPNTIVDVSGNGSIETLSVEVGDNAQFNSQSFGPTATTRLHLATRSMASLGSVSTLDVTVPVSCHDSSAQLDYISLSSLIINSKSVSPSHGGIEKTSDCIETNN